MSDTDNQYRNFRFRVRFSGRTVAGFDEVSPLPVDMKSTGRRVTGHPPLSLGPEGQCTPFFINLERGVTFDLGFERWISMVRCYGPATGKGSLLVEYKRPVTIEVRDGGGEIVCVYDLSRCWVDEYRAVPATDDRYNEIAIEHLRLGFETWIWDPRKRIVTGSGQGKE